MKGTAATVNCLLRCEFDLNLGLRAKWMSAYCLLDVLALCALSGLCEVMAHQLSDENLALLCDALWCTWHVGRNWCMCVWVFEGVITNCPLPAPS